MSSGDQQPQPLENFLIVAYRSLRGNNRKLPGRERNLLEASAERVAAMVEQFDLIPTQIPGIDTRIEGLPYGHGKSSFLFFSQEQNRKSARIKHIQPGPLITLDQLRQLDYFESLHIHPIGVSGLTIIIYKNYIVNLEGVPKIHEIKIDPATQVVIVTALENSGLAPECQSSYATGWGTYGRSYHRHQYDVYYITSTNKIAGFDMRTRHYTQTPDLDASETDGQLQDFCLSNPKKRAFWAVTAKGTIKYFEQFKLTYVLKEESESKPKEEEVLPMFCTIICDSEYLIAAAHCSGQNKNKLVAYKIKNTNRKLIKIGSALDAVPENFENYNNSVHRMIFMYPKRYRILIAQNLFSLNSAFVVGRNGITLLGTKRAVASRFSSNKSQRSMDDQSFL